MSEMYTGRPRKKVLAVSSGGGHWIQLMRLRPAFEDQDVIYASTQAEETIGFKPTRYYQLRDTSRFSKHNILVVAAQAFRIIWLERPDVVVTTGALPGLITIAIGRLFGTRTIWIDSIANCEVLSTSGRMARWFSSAWLTQWPHISEHEGPSFWGSVI